MVRWVARGLAILMLAFIGMAVMARPAAANGAPVTQVSAGAFTADLGVVVGH